MQQSVLQSKPVTITGINFKFNSSQLLGHDIRVLDEVANFAQKHPDAILDVNGYCSKVGSYAYNQSNCSPPQCFMHRFDVKCREISIQ